MAEDLVARLRALDRGCAEHFIKRTCSQAIDKLTEQAETIERLRGELEETHRIIRADVATQEALRLRSALLIIRDGFIPQGMSPALFAEKVLAEVPAVETEPASPVSR